jgi:hypothetical protein
MNIQEIINYLKKDKDFFNCYVDALQKEISKTKCVVTDIVFDYIKNWEDLPRLKKCYQRFLTLFIEKLFYETDEATKKPLIDYYFMSVEKISKTLGISWVELSGEFLNLDDLFDDFNLECNS